MRLSLTFPSTSPTWTFKEGPNDQLAAILGGGGGALPELVITYGPIIVRPDEPRPWMEQTARGDVPRESKVTIGRTGEGVTAVGWPLRFVEAEVVNARGELTEVRLCAFYTFMEHASVAIVRAANRAGMEAHGKAVLAILGSARPDWTGEPACLAEVWDLAPPRKAVAQNKPRLAAPVRNDAELAAALAETEAALAANPTALDHVRRGGLLLELERPGDALDALRAALALEPTLERAHYLSGVALGDLDKHAEAIAAWEKALALSPDRVDTVYNLAQARFFLKEFEAALVGFQTVARLDPDDFMTTRKIAQCLYALDRYDEGAAARVRFRELWGSTRDPRAGFITEFVFDQFQADGFWVHALETLRPRNPSVYVLLTFQAIEIHGHHEHPLPATVTVETSDQAKQAGTPFVLAVKAGRQYRVVGMSKDLPPYPELKADVIRLLAEALRPPAKA